MWRGTLGLAVFVSACAFRTGGLSGTDGFGGGSTSAATSSTRTSSASSASSTSSSTGTGGAPGCVVGSTKPCYDGPMGTESVGVCRDGTNVCQVGGTFAACAGSITPVPENCLSSEDQNCDGVVSTCTGSALAAWQIGGTGDEVALAVAVGPDGSVVVVGYFHDKVTIGTQLLMAADGSSDAFVAKFDAAGKPLWALRLGGDGDDEARGVALDANGAVLVVGSYRNRIDFDAKNTVLSDGSLNAFAAKFDAMGAFVWGIGFGDTSSDQAAESVVADSAGDAIVVGTFRNKIDLGSGVALMHGGDEDGFVLKLDPTGKPLWARAVTDVSGQNQDQELHHVALGATDAVVVVGEGNGDVDFGQGTVLSANGRNVLLARYSSNGKCSWGQTFGDDAEQHGYGLAVDGADNVIMTGSFGGTMQVGNLPALKATGTQDLFVAELDAAGHAVWSKAWGTNAGAHVVGTAVATDQFRNVVVGGFYDSGFDFFADASKALKNNGQNDAFVAKLGPNGAPAWSHGYGDYANEATAGVATYRATAVPSKLAPGAIAVAGWFGHVVDLGKGAITTAGGSDAFVGWLAP